MLYHKRKGHVNFKQGISFAILGAIGTIIGTQLGLLTPSQSLLNLFGVFVIAISIKMLIKGRISKDKARTTQEVISGSKDNVLNNHTISSRSRNYMMILPVILQLLKEPIVQMLILMLKQLIIKIIIKI
jgi:uncharacterized membrane protein YfcA